jgi:hypothetical protein
MVIIKILILTIVIIALVFLALATRILLKKKGKFPDTHIGSNQYLKSQGITCATTYDKIEQAKVKREMRFKQLKLDKVPR